MGKYRWKTGLLAFLFVLIGFHSTALADVEKLTISQIVQKGNDVYLYVNALNNEGKPEAASITPDQFSVTIDQSGALPVQEASVFQSLNQGVCYSFCIDISKSVTEEEMTEIRSSIADFINGMSANDYARIITIGTEVSAACEMTQDHGVLNAAIESVQRVADYTYLYKGISYALDGQKKNVETMPERGAMILFTDGMDDSDGASSEEQVLADLKEARIPIYVVGLKGTDSNANLNSVGQIARESGGNVLSYSDMSITEAVQTIESIMGNTYQLHMQPNQESYGSRDLVWNVTYNSDGYSVSSANYVYSLSMDGVVIETELPATEPPATEPPTTEPPTTEPPATEPPATEPQTEPATEPELTMMERVAVYVKTNLFLVGGIAIVAAVLIGLLIWVLLKNRGNKNVFETEDATEDEKRTEWEQDKTLDESEIEEDTIDEAEYDEKTISSIDDRSIKMSFEITFDGKSDIVERTLHDQLILGRGQECDVDVVFGAKTEEGKQTSRKHALIINRPDGLYIKDNASKNKTYLNGMEVKEEVALQDGDLLQLGKANVQVKILNY